MHGGMQLAKKRRLKAGQITLAAMASIHDRKALDLPINSRVSPGTVDDPYGFRESATWDDSRREWLSHGQPKIAVVRSLRDDPLAQLHSSGQIDGAAFYAGRHWQRAYEMAEVGGARAIDPTKEAVDGGRIPEPFTDTQRKAVGDLNRAARHLGQEGESIVRDVLARRMNIRMVAEARGYSQEHERKYIGRRFRECLDTLAEVFGYAVGRGMMRTP